MKLLALSGSRNHEGRTAKAIGALQKGFDKAGGGTTEAIFLVDHKLQRCLQCEADGWGICRREGTCIIKDDFAEIVDKIRAADVMVFANPVYFGDLSDSMRSFLDRYRRINFAKMRPAMGGVSPGGAPAIGFCLSGGGGGGAPNALANLERIMLGCGFDVVDMLVLRRQNFEMKLPILELTGAWLATKPSSGPPGPPR